MSEEAPTPDPLDAFRRAIEAANSRDLDALTSFYAPDAVWEIAGLGTHDGTAEIRRFFEDWLDAYEEFEVKLEEILDLGNGVGICGGRAARPPVGSTGHVQLRYATTSIWWMA